MVTFNLTGLERGDYTVDIGGSEMEFTVLAELSPAAFEVSSLVVNPEEVEPGKTVSISVNVANVGDLAGSITLELMIGNKVTESCKVELVIAGVVF